MQRAIDGMELPPDVVLIDAVNIDCKYPIEPIIKGDAKSYSIACASIVAKVTRDRFMVEMSQKYPEYDFASNKGIRLGKAYRGVEEYRRLSDTPQKFYQEFRG